MTSLTDRTHINLAFELDSVQKDLNLGKTKSAFERMVRLSATHSENLDFLRLFVRVLKARGDQKGMLAATKALGARSERIEDQLLYVATCLEIGEFKEANNVLGHLDMTTLGSHDLRFYLDHAMELAIHNGDVDRIFQLQRSYEASQIQTPRYFYSMALVEMRNNQEENAITHLRTALNLDPKMDIAWTALALLHHKLGDLELALGNLQSALDSNPYNQTALKLLSAWSWQQNELAKAEKYIDFYLGRFTFDESMTMNKISLFERQGQHRWASCEYSKLKFYFS